MRSLRAIVGIAILVTGVAAVGREDPVDAAVAGAPSGLEVYEGRMDAATFGALRSEGVDVEGVVRGCGPLVGARYDALPTDTVSRWSSTSWGRWRFGMTASGLLWEDDR